MPDFSLQHTTRHFALGRDACGQPVVRPLADLRPRVDVLLPFVRRPRGAARDLPAARGGAAGRG